MSSILKALKKLEEEKAQRRPDSLDIDAEILRSDAPSRISPVKMALIAAALFGCGGVATYVHMKQSQQKTVAAAPQPARLAEKPRNTDIPVETIAPDPVAPAAREASGTSGRSDRLNQETAAKHADVRGAGIKPAPEPMETVLGQQPSVKTHPIPEKRPVPALALPAAVKGQLPTLKVNGIAFQDGIDSVAMINGVPLTKGALIEGVRVENIQRDHVVFVYGTEKFEIPLGKSNR